MVWLCNVILIIVTSLLEVVASAAHVDTAGEGGCPIHAYINIHKYTQAYTSIPVYTSMLVYTSIQVDTSIHEYTGILYTRIHRHRQQVYTSIHVFFIGITIKDK